MKLPSLPKMEYNRVRLERKLARLDNTMNLDRGGLGMADGGWGGIGPGRWFQADSSNGAGTAVGGTCARCGKRVPANHLRLAQARATTVSQGGREMEFKQDIWVHVERQDCES